MFLYSFFLLYLSFWLISVFCHHISFICVTKKMKNSSEFWKKPLCFMTFFSTLQTATSAFHSEDHPTFYSVQSYLFLALLKLIPAWYYSQIWWLLPLLYGCCKPVAFYPSLDRKHERDIWFILLTSLYPCPAINITWTEFIFLSLLSQWRGRFYHPPSCSGLYAGNSSWLAALANTYWSFQKYLSLPVYSS